ncbi:MAG: TylF/MycF/NovP-related O-methyltransferase [Nitrospinota bacterium]
MVQLPDFSKAMEYENHFYMSCDSTRLSKVIAQYELYKMTMDIPGVIMECGIFKGTSLSRFAMFRQLFGNTSAKKIIGFDVFGKFPETNYEEDKKVLGSLFTGAAGDTGVSKEQMLEILKNKNCDDNLELVEGDICETLPKYLQENPQLKISLLNLDTDIYEPAVTILECCWDRIESGGILIVDDYGVFPGETKAVTEFLKSQQETVKKFYFAKSPCYIIKK